MTKIKLDYVHVQTGFSVAIWIVKRSHEHATLNADYIYMGKVILMKPCRDFEQMRNEACRENSPAIVWDIYVFACQLRPEYIERTLSILWLLMPHIFG